MTVVFDPAKSAANKASRGLPFEMIETFQWRTALVDVAKTQESTATRFHAVGRIGCKLHVVIFTFEADGIRVISLRRARVKEERLWRSARTPG